MKLVRRFRFTIVILALGFLELGTAWAQGLPSRYREIVNVLRGLRAQPMTIDQTSGLESAKCGLWLTFEVLKAWPTLTEYERATLHRLLAPPTRDTNRVIGKFRIYYDTSGTNEPLLLDANFLPVAGTREASVDSTGAAFNHAWRTEIDTLGYDSPPLESDSLYHVYISELGPGFYGQTWSESGYAASMEGPPRYRTYIEIDNDFRFVYVPTRGIPALKVTAAHEFHHAIQIGAYGVWDTERYFYEITSTWMEDVVYTEVNDYYQYFSNNPGRRSHFAHPEIAFTTYDGSYEYSRCIWGIFLQYRYSRDVMRHVWENMREISTIPSLDAALNSVGTTFRQAFAEFAYWNSVTGPSADTLHFYPEGRHYPAIRTRPSIDFFPPSQTVDDSVQAIASVYLPIILNGEQSLAIISNLNIAAAYSPGYFPFTYRMQTAPDNSFRHLGNGLYVKLDVGDPQNWYPWETVPTLMEDVFVYPNPFRPGAGRSVKFRFPTPPQGDVELTILASSLAQVYSNVRPLLISANLEARVEWDGLDNGNQSVSTGIYFFVLSTSTGTYKGKFSVIRE